MRQHQNFQLVVKSTVQLHTLINELTTESTCNILVYWLPSKTDW